MERTASHSDIPIAVFTGIRRPIVGIHLEIGVRSFLDYFVIIVIV
ncbi:MAG TPA: hypothetical protein VK638_11890 [Edaphobacter sp.]|nr:hypothetical protein [Edaphobacter sp.]